MKFLVTLASILLVVSARKRGGGGKRTPSQIRNAIKSNGPNCNFTSPSGDFTIASFGGGGVLGLFRNANNMTKKVVLIGPSGLAEYNAMGNRVRGLSAFDRNGISAQWVCGLANFTDVAADGSEVSVLGAQATTTVMKEIRQNGQVIRTISIKMTAAVLETTTYATVCRPRDPTNCTVVELPFGLKFSFAVDNWKFASSMNYLKLKVKATMPKILRNIRRRRKGATTYGSARARRVVAANILSFDQGEMNNPETAMYGCNSTTGGEVPVNITYGRSQAILDLTYTFGAYPSDCLLEYDPVVNDNGAATTSSPMTTTVSAAASTWLGVQLAIVAGLFVYMS